MLKHLSLENFRNHKKFELDLGQTTVLVGLNGAGKSNVLEALTLLSFCRSFREEDKKNLINYETEYSRITGDDLEIFLTKSPRLFMQAKERGVVKKLSRFIGALPTVIFSSETISIITGAPGDRRRFLDVMISQVDGEYLQALIDYRKVKQQRTMLLSRIQSRQAGESEINFWDKELIALGKIIAEKREKAIFLINKNLPGLYQNISGDEKNSLEIIYKKNPEGDLAQAIESGRRREIAAGKTLFGPHRDDIVFSLNGRNMANFASRGEIRSAILALKIAELKYLEQSKKNDIESAKPMLLLDDIFSEFDQERRTRLGNLVLEYQSLITTTEKEHLSPELLKKAKIVEVTATDRLR